jgi:hypothetical protein
MLAEYFLVSIKVSQYIATTSVHNNNRSGLTTDSVNVYSEVGTKLLYICYLKFVLKDTPITFQVGCRRPTVRRPGFDSGPAFMVKKWHWGRSFSKQFGCPFSVQLQYNSMLVFHIVTLLFVGQIGKAWEPSAIGERNIQI